MATVHIESNKGDISDIVLMNNYRLGIINSL